MGRRLVRIGVALGLLWSAPSLAQSGSCPGDYDADAMLDQLTAVEILVGETAATSGSAARRFMTDLGCLNEILPNAAAHHVLSRVFRAIATGLVVGGDKASAEGWYLSALAMNRVFEYGLQDLSADHPAREVYRDLKLRSSPVATARPGVILGAGEHFLDGKPITEAAAPPGPHLYQLRTDTAVRSWVIEGNAFPPEATAAAVAVDRPPKRGKEPKPVAAGPAKPGKPPKTPEPGGGTSVLALEVAGGVGLGGVDHGGDVRLWQDRESTWLQEGPVSASRPRFEARVAVAPTPGFDLGVLLGVQLSETTASAGLVSGSSVGETDEVAKSGMVLVVQPRVRLTPVELGSGDSPVDPYVFGGVELAFSSALEVEGYPAIGGGMVPGLVVGGGLSFDLNATVSLLVEAGATGHFGRRAQMVQVGPVPLGRPNPEAGSPWTTALVAGLQVNL